MERKQFTFYRSFFESIENLPTKKEKADAYRMICDYALNGNLPDLKGKKHLTATIFSFVQPVLDTAGKRAQKCIHREQMRNDTVQTLCQQE